MSSDTITAFCVGVGLTFLAVSFHAPHNPFVGNGTTASVYVRQGILPIDDCTVEKWGFRCRTIKQLYDHPVQQPFEKMGFMERWDRMNHSIRTGVVCPLYPYMPNGLLCVDGVLRDPLTLDEWKADAKTN